MKTKFTLSVILNSLLISFIANCFLSFRFMPQSLFVIAPSFILANIFAGTLFANRTNKTPMVCQHGTVLLYSFCVSVILSTAYQILFAIKTIPVDLSAFLWSLTLCFAVNFIVFWNGIISVYLTSLQLGLKWRILGII